MPITLTYYKAIMVLPGLFSATVRLTVSVRWICQKYGTARFRWNFILYYARRQHPCKNSLKFVDNFLNYSDNRQTNESKRNLIGEDKKQSIGDGLCARRSECPGFCALWKFDYSLTAWNASSCGYILWSKWKSDKTETWETSFDVRQSTIYVACRLGRRDAQCTRLYSAVKSIPRYHHFHSVGSKLSVSLYASVCLSVCLSGSPPHRKGSICAGCRAYCAPVERSFQAAYVHYKEFVHAAALCSL